MEKKNRIAWILALLLLSQTLTGCQAEQTETEQEQEQEQEQEAVTPVETEPETLWIEQTSVPDTLKYDGRTVTIQARWTEHDGITEENGEIVNDIIYKRNRAIEEQLDIAFDWVLGQPDGVPTGTFTGELDAYFMAGEQLYDIMINSAAILLPRREYFMDMKNIDYIDLSKPWWWDKANDEMTYGADKIYPCLIGDIEINAHFLTYCMYYNMDLYEDEFGNGKELLELVASDDWTYDVFIEKAQAVTRDTDGDGTINPEHDQYALAQTYPSAVVSLALSMDDFDWYTTNTDTGTRTVNEFNERMADWAMSVANLLKVGLNDQNDKKSSGDFYNGNVMFFEYTLGYAKNVSANMSEDRYGILPNPKLDENQEGYQSFIESDVLCWWIPILAVDSSLSGAVMEALACYAYNEVRPIFITSVLQSKYVDNEESIRSVEIIIDSAHMNFLRYYTANTNFYDLVSRMYAGDGTNAASKYQASYKSMAAAVEKICAE